MTEHEVRELIYAALQFYADGANWERRYVGQSQWAPELSEAEKDRGVFARATLDRILREHAPTPKATGEAYAFDQGDDPCQQD